MGLCVLLVRMGTTASKNLRILQLAAVSPANALTIPTGVKIEKEALQVIATSEALTTIQQLVKAGTPPHAVIVEYDADVHDATAQTEAGSASSSASSDTAAKSSKPSAEFLHLIGSIANLLPATFLVVLTADNSAMERFDLRWSLFQHRAHMVTSLAAPEALLMALEKVACQVKAQMVNANSKKPHRSYSCAFCPTAGLPEDAIHAHGPLFHANTFQKGIVDCSICGQPQKNYFVHIHNAHGPQGRGEVPNENVYPNYIHPYSLCVIRRPSDGKFLMTQEFSNSGFWLPGGRSENGESLQEAAIRETLEEAGVRVKLTGILRMEYTSRSSGSPDKSGSTRLRVFFLGEPIDEAEGRICKTLPDYESVGAVWASIEDLPHITLRGSEPLKWFRYIANGGDVYPLSLLKEEGQ